MSDTMKYVETIKELKQKLKIAVDALEAIEICTNLTEANINYQPLKPIVIHNHKTCKDALMAINGKVTERMS